MIETINKIVRTSRQMLHEIGREPTPEELAEKLAMPLEKVRKVLKIAKEPISLETPIGDEEDSHLGDFIEDKNAILPIDAAIQSNLRETTTRVLASLTPREERVLRMNPDPPDLKDVVDESEPAELFWVIKNGIKMTGMPSFGVAGASDDEIWKIVAFVKKWPSVTPEDFKAWTASATATPPG